MTWDTDDVDVYYNGTSTKTPPVTLSITYSLDGTEMTEKELRGKSGHLEMTIHVTNNEKQRKTINGKEQDLYTPFVVGMVLDMPTKTFKNVHAGDANVISDSTNQLVSLLSVPGLKENFGDLLTDDMKDLTDKLPGHLHGGSGCDRVRDADLYGGGGDQHGAAERDRPE